MTDDWLGSSNQPKTKLTASKKAKQDDPAPTTLLPGLPSHHTNLHWNNHAVQTLCLLQQGMDVLWLKEQSSSMKATRH